MPYFDDDNMSQYSQVNVMAAYVSMIRFAMDKLELHLDELGDDILFDGLSPFPEDVLGDDSLLLGIVIRGILTMSLISLGIRNVNAMTVVAAKQIRFMLIV